MPDANHGRYLSARHAVVTGGGRGIGAAIADELARLGADLTLMGRDESRLEWQAARLEREHGARVTFARCDVGDEDSVRAAFGAARDRFGHPYVLVNNAGQGAAGGVVTTDRSTWDRVLAVNLTGPFLCMQEVVPAMLAAKEGRVVNIASTASLKGYNKMLSYCASKHGVLGLTRSAAIELAKHGVTVNAVCPGYTDTDMTQEGVDNLVQALGISPEEALKMIVRKLPRGTLIRPSEVANAVAWLCSPEATAITGQAIVVAAGEVM
jgi:NAD(P)-dependent dehydrogenase (short-subunit alcohol dehydrogenase family)